jgi:hypothetical protein
VALGAARFCWASDVVGSVGDAKAEGRDFRDAAKSGRCEWQRNRDRRMIAEAELARHNHPVYALVEAMAAG